eukprot:jgi/Picsp_1/4387/NSC_01893-R1_atp-binding cassette superfamily
MLGSTAWCRIEGSLVPRPPVQDWTRRCWKGSLHSGVNDAEKGKSKTIVWSSEYSKSLGSWRVKDGMQWEEEQSASTSLNAEKKPVVGETSVDDEEDVLIEFRDVHKSFGSKHILKGASFKIRRGEAVGIIGSSGTGKSTTLRLAAGLLEPDSYATIISTQGEILIKGEARQGLLSDDDTSDKLNIGLVFQSGALFDSLTVKENVGFMLYEHTNLSEEEISKAVSESLSKVGLSGVENLYPSELSGGMKKRVALARAIVTDRSAGANAAEQVIMYDEPTAGLDPVASTVIEDLIRSIHDPKYAKNRQQLERRQHDGQDPRSRMKTGANFDNEPVSGVSSYIVVTHQHSTIRRSVDRIIFLHGGKVVWEGDIKEFDATSEPIVRQFASGSLEGPIVYV